MADELDQFGLGLPTCQLFALAPGGTASESLFPESPEPEVISKSCMPVSKRSTSPGNGAISLTSRMQDGTLNDSRLPGVDRRWRAPRNCQGARKREPASARLPPPGRHWSQSGDGNGDRTRRGRRSRHRRDAEKQPRQKGADSQDSRSGRLAEQAPLWRVNTQPDPLPA